MWLRNCRTAGGGLPFFEMAKFDLLRFGNDERKRAKHWLFSSLHELILGQVFLLGSGKTVRPSDFGLAWYRAVRGRFPDYDSCEAMRISIPKTFAT